MPVTFLFRRRAAARRDLSSWGAAVVLLLSLASCGDDGARPPADTPEDPADRILFEGSRNGQPEIFSTDIEAGEPALVFPPGTRAQDPTPSPDGTRIAYVIADYDSSTGDIWVAGADGSAAARLTDDPELDDEPAWSPDGRRIAFRTFRSLRAGEIWVMDADGSALVNLTPPSPPGVVDHRRPAWSPDGTRIAYASTEGGDWGIWMMAADGSDKRQVTNTIDLDAEPCWSPDGTRLVFRRSSASRGSELMIVQAAGGEPVPLSLPDDQRMPAWSPDGDWIACVTQDGPAGQPEIMAVRPDATGAFLVTARPEWGGGINPAWLRR